MHYYCCCSYLSADGYGSFLLFPWNIIFPLVDLSLFCEVLIEITKEKIKNGFGVTIIIGSVLFSLSCHYIGLSGLLSPLPHFCYGYHDFEIKLPKASIKLESTFP